MLFYEGFEEKVRRYMASNPNYGSALPARNRALATPAAASLGDADGPQEEPGDQQLPIYFRFDATGHIMIASTDKEENSIDPKVRELFQKATVLFAAVAKALATKQKKLYDYDAIDQIYTKSGFMMGLGVQDRTFHSDDVSLTLDKAIVNIALSAIGNVAAAGTAATIAQKILNGMSSELKFAASSNQATRKVGHMLIVCQNLMGMPLVNVTMFFINSEEATKVISTPCSTARSNSVDFTFHQQDYMFIDPKTIEQFTDDFKTSPKFDELSAKLAGYIA